MLKVTAPDRPNWVNPKHPGLILRVSAKGAQPQIVASTANIKTSRRALQIVSERATGEGGYPRWVCTPADKCYIDPAVCPDCGRRATLCHNTICKCSIGFKPRGEV